VDGFPHAGHTTPPQRIAHQNWAGTLSAEFQNSLLNKWFMSCFGGYGTMDACNHDQAMLNLHFITVRAVSGLTLLAAMKTACAQLQQV
jgi:hypothetical protein